MVGSGGGELRAPIFNGENFDFWLIKMKTIFRSHELWDLVENGYETPMKNEEELTETEKKLMRENVVKDARALGIIQAVIENTKDLDTIDAHDVVAILKGYEQKVDRHGESSMEKAFAKCWVKNKVKCHKCSKIGHIARYCNTNKAVQQVNFPNQVEETGNLFYANHSGEMKKISDEWYIDSGCSNHMTFREYLLVDIDINVKAKVQVGTGNLVEVAGKGILIIETMKGRRYIREVMFVPSIAQNLLSVGQMTEHGYFLLFRDYKVDVFDDRSLKNLVVNVKQKGNRCFPLILNTNKELALRTNVQGDAKMWHKRFKHLNFRSLKLLHSQEMVLELPEIQDSNDVCQGCVLVRHHRELFSKEITRRAHEPLELIHYDVCGPMKVPTTSGNRYFLTFIDDYSRMCWIYFMRNKSKVFGIFKKFRAMVELQCGYPLKKLRSDKGGEFTSTEFNAFCESIRMERQLTVSYTPQKNGVSERKNRTIVEMAKSMLHEKKLPYKLWGEAVNTAVYLLNRCSTSALNCVTPFEAYTGRKPWIKHLKVFGVVCYSLIPRDLRHKLDASSVK
ncbi:unnamed protein product [Malus baccata var. baccata]